MPRYTSLAIPVVDTVDGRTLPWLRGLKRLRDARPKLVIDSREQAPLVFTRLEFVCGTLPEGDYGILGLRPGLFAVERKTCADFVSCCLGDNRARFERELTRLKGYDFARLLIIGSLQDLEAGRHHSKINPKSVVATAQCFDVRFIPVVFRPSAEAAARQIEIWAYYYAREITLGLMDYCAAARQDRRTTANSW